MITLGLDIGSNSVGSLWSDPKLGVLATATSIFPAGVDESDDKRGDPKNAKRRMTRRTRITLARRAERKRELRLKLISAGLLPADAAGFKALVEESDPWTLRRTGLDNPLTPYEFGRVLLHLAQRRGTMGFNSSADDKGKVKRGILHVRMELLDRYGSENQRNEGQKTRKQIRELGEKKKRSDEENDELEAAHEELAKLCMEVLKEPTVTFGRLIADLRDERVTSITTEDKRPEMARKGPREYRNPIRNKAGNYEHCADRAMIREEFAKLWDKQKSPGAPVADILTNELRLALDDESGDSTWRHKGLLFGQRRQSWDLGTLGRCVLEPTERCAPHADMYASRYLVVETVNNLKIIERGKEKRSLTVEERQRIKEYLSGPLGIESPRRKTGQTTTSPPRAKQTVSANDLRAKMAEWYGKEKWLRDSKRSPFRFEIEESDAERPINTDWFSREIVHGAITLEKWRMMAESVREGLNHAILKFDPDDEKHAEKLKAGVMSWAGLSEAQANSLVAAWRRRPKLDAKRLNMSRRAVRNLLIVMDRGEPWPVPDRPGTTRWLTQIEARKLIAEDANFVDATTGKPLNEYARRRYATGAKGATARDRHYMHKHLLKKNGKIIYGADGLPLAEPPPAPLISNPVVRKAIHEVRRHLIEYMTTFERKPDEVYIELSREAKMGKKDADAVLIRNRLRNRIRNDIAATFDLHSRSSTQRRVAEDRVILCMQQGGVCPLCGNQIETTKITPRMAANGEGCEVAHIIPKASGGHNGLANIVLAHTKCNRDMGRRTPREFWDAITKGGFAEGIRYVEGIYQDIQRPKPSEVKNAAGDSLWSCYFTGRPGRFGPTFDELKIEQFKKDITDIQQMTNRQDAATKYAARQVMAYLADALFDGKGLPERGGERKIFATDGLWTSRLRREWGLFFDPHKFKAKGLNSAEESERKEKNRGDHRHHAIDAAVIAFCSRQVQTMWEEREKQADRDRINTADEEAMENYRRLHPLHPPSPFKTREDFREAVRQAVFGDGEIEKPICHRPVKRKLIGYLHKATQYGPVIDTWKQGSKIHRELVEGRVTVRQAILGEEQGNFLKPAHLRMPRTETDEEAIERLARRLRIGKCGLASDDAIKAARKLVKSKAFTRANVDPKPEKGGIVRDIGLRRLLRRKLEDRELNPDEYSKAELKQSIDKHGPLTQDSGIPIYNVVLLWSNNDPVSIRRDHYDYASGQRRKLDDPGSLRLYDSQNNHHIEIRVAKGKKGNENWSGEIVTAFEAAQRKVARLRAFREAGIPKPRELRKLAKSERAKFTPILREIEKAYPLVDRRDTDEKGGRFVMSLCEGEMLLMKHKRTGEVGYFVVAKLDKPSSPGGAPGIVLVPHWDARAAGERKDAHGNKVPDSRREQFSVRPADLKNLAPPDHNYAVKVRVSPLGVVMELHND